ncbi:MAG: 3-dehydroquinate synthase [Deferribacterales bacterium]|nr:3-dehydroquinate synthase [Deferribacterales bacterium]
MKTVKVDLKKEIDNSYEILIGSDFIKGILADFDPNATFYVIDKNVFNLYPFLRELKNKYIFETSEKSKNINSVAEILNFLKNSNCLRDSKLVAVGGGIIGDVAGFAASIFMRGIDYYQVPTTLLSMVDSSVGGKTGVNLGDTKNLVGSFYQPKAVYIDMKFLNTLSFEEYKNGLAEVIKYAVMFDESFYNMLIENYAEVEQRGNILQDIILKCCQIKADVVKEDEKEKGRRMLLNFGHTFGHAIEVDSEHKIKHGFAVATGMYLETLFGQFMKQVDSDVTDKIRIILERYGFELNYKYLDEEKFIGAIAMDKKARQSGVVLALTQKVGSGMLLKGVELNFIREFFVSLRS